MRRFLNTLYRASIEVNVFILYLNWYVLVELKFHLDLISEDGLSIKERFQTSHFIYSIR